MQEAEISWLRDVKKIYRLLKLIIQGKTNGKRIAGRGIM